MQAAYQPGIPTAFIVGKDSKIEWIGHPMRMDEPLASGGWPLGLLILVLGLRRRRGALADR